MHTIKQEIKIIPLVRTELSIWMFPTLFASRLQSFRKAGYGRGKRCQLEPEKVEILSGIVGGKTIGSPIALMIRNADYKNHQHYMDPLKLSDEEKGKINIPLPGHADLAGMLKYGFNDCRYPYSLIKTYALLEPSK